MPTRAEHHSNLLPRLRLLEKGVEVTLFDPLSDGTTSLVAFDKAIEDRTRLVAVTHASNVLGLVVPGKEIARTAHDHDTLILADEDQSVPHLTVDVTASGATSLHSPATRCSGRWRPAYSGCASP